MWTRRRKACYHVSGNNAWDNHSLVEGSASHLQSQSKLLLEFTFLGLALPLLGDDQVKLDLRAMCYGGSGGRGEREI